MNAAKDLESPFLEEEVLSPEPHRELDPRLATFVQQSPSRWQSESSILLLTTKTRRAAEAA